MQTLGLFVPSTTPYKAPTGWPQDDVTPPHGYGSMGPTTFNNRHNVLREYFIYGSTVLSVAAGASGSANIRIQPDADFWCESIIMQTQNAGATSRSPKIFIKDLRTDNLLTYPFGRLHNYQLVNSVNTARIPTCGRLQGELHKPYCFARNGAIFVTIENDTNVNPLKTYIGFLGWKEYENVSQ